MSRNRRALVAVKYAALTLFAVPWVVVPFWLVIVNSFKPAGEAARLELTLPETWAIGENYLDVFVRGEYLHALLNSLIITVPTVAIVCLVGAAAAWAFARSRSRIVRAAFFAISLSILIPPTIIPTFYLLRDLGLSASTVGYVLVLVGTKLGVVVFLATGFVRGISPELEEAAAIDGAGRVQIFFRIVLPLISPALFVAGIIVTIMVWGEFFFATFLLPGGDRATLPLSLFSFASSSAQSLRWNLVFAYVLMTGVPIIVAYLLLQRRVLTGLTDGALKG